STVAPGIQLRIRYLGMGNDLQVIRGFRPRPGGDYPMATVRSGLLATVSAFALMGSAYAADLPAAPALKAPPLAVSSWAGWYAGIQGGYGRLNFTVNMITENGMCGDDPGTTCTGSASGFAAGGQLGYLWQSRNWVWGFEGDGMWTDLKH